MNRILEVVVSVLGLPLESQALVTAMLALLVTGLALLTLLPMVWVAYKSISGGK